MIKMNFRMKKNICDVEITTQSVEEAVSVEAT